MTPLLMYFLKVNLIIGILFLAYYYLLRKEKFFTLNRIILLSIIALAFALPLLPAIEGSAGRRIQRDVLDMGSVIGLGPFQGDGAATVITNPQPARSNAQPVHETAFPFTVVNVLEGLYVLVAMMLILRLLFQLCQVCIMIKRSRREKVDGIVYCHHGLELPPFSFFRFLVLNRDQYPPAEAGQIIAHERVHIRQGHGFDLLLVEFLRALCWINPLLIGLTRAVKLNLEFIADEKVVDTGVDIKSYQYSILHCLQHPGMPLVNSYASSKIKLRIYMMNKKRSPMRNLYKYALALPLLAGTYLIVNPLKARSMPPPPPDKMTDQPERQDLKAFEGYYQNDVNKDAYIQIRANGAQLILKEMWHDQEISFNQTSDLEFSGRDGNFPLKFSKDANGAIVEVLAFNRDHWNKVKVYTPVTYISLQPAQLKPFEGYYQMGDKEGKMAFIQIESTSDGLLLRQGWDGLEIPFRPTSSTAFFCKKANFPLEFTKGSNEVITEVTAFRHDHWKKMKDPSGAVIKRGIKLEVAQLKKLEGEYQLQHPDGGSSNIHIEGRDGHIVLIQRWDNQAFNLVASSPTEFFSKEMRFPVVFTVDKDGIATELLAFDKDRWVKIK